MLCHRGHFHHLPQIPAAAQIIEKSQAMIINKLQVLEHLEEKFQASNLKINTDSWRLSRVIDPAISTWLQCNFFYEKVNNS